MKKTTKKEDWTNREEWNGQSFEIHGAELIHCSGKVSRLEFEIPDIRGDQEHDFEYVNAIIGLRFFKKFPMKNKNLRQTKIDVEEMWTHQLRGDRDPVKFGGCRTLKVHYVGEPAQKYHFI